MVAGNIYSQCFNHDVYFEYISDFSVPEWMYTVNIIGPGVGGGGIQVPNGYQLPIGCVEQI